MKAIMIMAAVFILCSCHHSMSPWPSDGERQEVAMYVRTARLSGINSLPSVYQLFVYDKTQNLVKRYDITAENDNPNLLHAELFPGSYTAYCITNAEDAEAWEYAESSPPDQIYLKAQKTSKGTEEARDFLMGKAEIEVGENGGTAVFDLDRKVAMLKVIIRNIPEWLTDLQINLSGIPQKINLEGITSGQYTVVKDVSLPNQEGTSETSLLVFPPANKAGITLSSESLVYVSSEHTIESILPNHITEITATFGGSPNAPQLDITTRLKEWEEEIIREDPWLVELPSGPCQGEGNGKNLVNNPGFEEDFHPEDKTSPWKLDAGGASKSVTAVTTDVRSGSYAVRLEGKTYLYQDIPVNGGNCYQLKLFAKAASSNVKWRYWCTWMQGSTSLNSETIRSSSYLGMTDGYTDIFDGGVFRAPASATKLRLEIRTYMDSSVTEGLYVDDCSVEAID